MHRGGCAPDREQPSRPRRASGHTWRLAPERSIRGLPGGGMQACGLLRMTSYRAGRIVGYEGGGDGIRTAPRQERHEDELPLVPALTCRWTGRVAAAASDACQATWKTDPPATVKTDPLVQGGVSR